MASLTDTDPTAQAVLNQLLRKAPIWRKLELMGELNETARTLALGGLRERYPDASNAMLRRHLADLLLGPELAFRAYGAHTSSKETDDD